MSDVEGVPAAQSGHHLHGATEPWLSFESRMRRRRVGRCLLRADLAMDDGCLPDARIALDEARHLDANSEELAALEARFQELSSPAITISSESSAPTVVEPEPPAVRSAPPSRRWLVTAGAGAILLIAGVSFGSLYWRNATLAEPGPSPRPDPPVVSTAGTAPLMVPSNAEATGLRVVQETVKAPTVRPELVGDEPTLPVFPAPPIAAPDPEPQPAPVVLAANRSDTIATPTLPDPPRAEIRFDALASAPPPEPPAKPVSNPIDDLPVAAPEPRSVDESSVVRGILARYERAYNTLDAEAASAVWPGVDRGALARAFDGLSSQRVSLKACDVTVTGPAARAICSGTAMWVPKIGGGAKTAARRWDFELRKRGEDWQIERAVAR